MSDIRNGKNAEAAFRDRFLEYSRRYPHAGFGHKFRSWIDNHVPYGSLGNGFAMRVSPVGWLCNDADEVLALAQSSAQVSHDHTEGMKGVESVALAVFMARHGAEKDEIRSKISQLCGYDLNRSLASVRENGYRWCSASQYSVPEAMLLKAQTYLDSHLSARLDAWIKRCK